MTDWKGAHASGFVYEAFLAAYGTDTHRARWNAVYERVVLSDRQRTVLAGFTRRMNVLCVAGAWCGDCVNQCPAFARFAEATPSIDLRFVDRDADPTLMSALSLNAGHRVPVVVFCSEDDHECGRYGERTLSMYRRLAAEQLGPACPTGIAAPSEDALSASTAEWLGEFERIQLMLRLSPRLREKHGD